VVVRPYSNFMIAGIEGAHRMTITNTEADARTVQEITVLGSDDSVSGVEGGSLVDEDACTGVSLEPNESCKFQFSTLYESGGVKTVTFNIDSIVDGTKKEISEVKALSVFVLLETDFSHAFGESVKWYTKKLDEWEYEAGAVAQLTSELNEFDSTALIAQVAGSGELQFDWKVDDLDRLALSLYVDRQKVEDFVVSESFSRVSYTFAEGEHTIEWKVEKAENWEVTEVKARIKGVSFKADAVEEEEVLPVSDSGGGGGSVLLLLLLFVASIYSFGRNNGKYGVLKQL